MNLLARASLFGLALLLNGCAIGGTYSAKSIEGWVVDAKTKQPIEGAVVVATWDLSWGMENNRSYYMTLMESVTDAAGRYSFPAWGPKSTAKRVPISARFFGLDPELMFFKSGYRYDVKTNPLGEAESGRSTRSSEWNGTTVALKPVGEGEMRSGNWSSYRNSLARYHPEDLPPETPCYWRLIPKAVMAEHREYEILLAAKLVSKRQDASQLLEEWEAEEYRAGKHIPLDHPECGSPTAFFEGLMK